MKTRFECRTLAFFLFRSLFRVEHFSLEHQISQAALPTAFKINLVISCQCQLRLQTAAWGYETMIENGFLTSRAGNILLILLWFQRLADILFIDIREQTLWDCKYVTARLDWSIAVGVERWFVCVGVKGWICGVGVWSAPSPDAHKATHTPGQR